MRSFSRTLILLATISGTVFGQAKGTLQPGAGLTASADTWAEYYGAMVSASATPLTTSAGNQIRSDDFNDSSSGPAATGASAMADAEATIGSQFTMAIKSQIYLSNDVEKNTPNTNVWGSSYSQVDGSGTFKVTVRDTTSHMRWVMQGEENGGSSPQVNAYHVQFSESRFEVDGPNGSYTVEMVWDYNARGWIAVINGVDHGLFGGSVPGAPVTVRGSFPLGSVKKNDLVSIVVDGLQIVESTDDVPGTPASVIHDTAVEARVQAEVVNSAL